MQNRFYLVLIQFLGYLWYGCLFILILPYMLAFLSIGLDYFIFDNYLGVDVISIFSVIPSELLNLTALVVFSFGALIVVESIAVMYGETHAFPFTVVQHEDLTPKELINGGWYGRVRHPMVLGYAIMLIGFGLFIRSPSLILWWVPLVTGLMLEYGLMVEEKRMVRWFGKEYEAYQKKVPALIPKLGKKHSSK